MRPPKTTTWAPGARAESEGTPARSGRDRPRGRRVRRALVAGLILALCGAVTGCDTPGPDDAARGFYTRALAYRQQPDESLLRELYEALDAETRAIVAARATAASAALGSEIPPWTALSLRGIAAGGRLTDVDVLEQGEDRAVVAVSFASAVPAKLGGPATDPEAVRVTVVREDGRWRLRLPLPVADEGAP